MKTFFTGLLTLIMLLSGLNQLNAQFPTERKCGTMEYLAWQKSQDPGLEARMNVLEEQLQTYLKSHENQLKSSTATVTIPVVVHVVYNTADQNISEARVIEQINVLNTDFAGDNTNGELHDFATSLKADCEVQFCLARRTPGGEATNGIERRQTNVNSFTTNNAVKYYKKGGLDAWDPTKYLNIWVCNLGNDLLGYAQFPTSGVNNTFGVVILYSAFGLTGAVPPFHLGGTTTHELGHCFNLYHIWGDDGSSCLGSDNCGDTPNQAGYNWGCPAFPHITCSNGPLGDMFMNFMDYSDDACYTNFTPDQKARLQAALSSSGPLYSLTTSDGCVPPGTVTCNAPTGLNESGIGDNTATLQWGAVSGALNYIVQYRTSGGGTWNNNTSLTNSLSLTNLVASTQYEWQVQTVCASGSSNFSGLKTFWTTGPGCYDIYESNQTMAEAKQISANTNISALIGSSTDYDWFKFFNNSSQKKIQITLTNLPADYDISLYKSNGSLIATSQQAGNSNEVITYNTKSVGSYYVRVYPAGSAFSTGSCYTLRANISNSNFKGLEPEEENVMNTPRDLFIYPNPSLGPINMVYNSPKTETMHIVITEVSGRIVFSESLNIVKGLNQQVIHADRLAPGLYFIELRGNAGILQRKLVVD